jgi:hypothetical protein
MAVPVVSLIRQFSDSIESTLTSVGWHVTQRRGDYLRLTKIEFESIVFALDPNPSESMGGISLNPSVGVATDDFATLHNELFQLSGDLSMIGTTLATILRKDGIKSAPYTRWLGKTPDELKGVQIRFFDDLDQFGMPFLRSFPTRAAIIQELEMGPRQPVELSTLAIAYAQAGQLNQAAEVLADYVRLGELEGKNTPMFEYMSGFALRFTEHFQLNLPE